MKFRTGFVSNSSSTSFCILGITLPVVDENDWECYTNGDVSEYNDYYDYVNDIIYEHSKILTSYYNREYEETIYIGTPFSEMVDTETLAEFKMRVKSELSKILPLITNADESSNIELDIIEECWQN